MSVKPVIGAFLALAIKPDGLVFAAVVDEFRAQHLASPHGFAVGFQGFVDHAETVALAQVASEVDIRSEDFGELDRYAVGQVDRIGGSEQRTANGAAGQSGRCREFTRFEARTEPSVLFFDHQPVELTAVIGQPACGQSQQFATVGGFHADQLARAARKKLFGDWV